MYFQRECVELMESVDQFEKSFTALRGEENTQNGHDELEKYPYCHYLQWRSIIFLTQLDDTEWDTLLALRVFVL